MSSTAAPVEPLLRFDIFELDVRTGELRKRGAKVRLQGQPLQVLEKLLRRPGDLVTREELRAQIWKADTFVDFDHSLHNAIARIREVLGDSAETPRYIETLPRHGYRFIGALEEERQTLRLAEESGRQTLQELALVPPPQQKKSPILLTLCALLVLGFVAWA